MVNACEVTFKRKMDSQKEDLEELNYKSHKDAIQEQEKTKQVLNDRIRDCIRENQKLKELMQTQYTKLDDFTELKLTVKTLS